MKCRLLVSISFCLIGTGSAMSAHAQSDVSFAWRGYAQLTGEWDDADDGIVSDIERLRPRVVVTAGQFSGLVQLDFGVPNLGDRHPGVLANGIMDAHVDYDFRNAGRLRFGQYKTPLGFDFNTPAHQLDITKRGMEFGLTLNRAMGAMYSDKVGDSPFSFDVGLFNTPGFSAATIYDDAQVGQDNALVERIRFDDGPWHAEAAHAQAEGAGGPNTTDFSVYDLALQYSADQWFAKFEWIDGDDIRGQQDRSEQVWFVHGTWRLSPKLALIGRHYSGHSEVAGRATDLSNTYLGFTLWPADAGRFETRLQVNYVIASGDEVAYTGLRGFRDDALFAQFQFLIQSE